MARITGDDIAKGVIVALIVAAILHAFRPKARATVGPITVIPDPTKPRPLGTPVPGERDFGTW